MLAGAPQTGTTLGLLFMANAAAVGVLLWQRWDWLGFACFVVAGPQWVGWLLETGSVAGSLLALVAFGALGVGAAIGFELRVPAARLRSSSGFLLAINALTLAGAGWLAFTGQGDRALGGAWLCFLAVAHLGVGAVSSRLERISRGRLAARVRDRRRAGRHRVQPDRQRCRRSRSATPLPSVVFAWLLRRERSGELAQTVVEHRVRPGSLALAMAHVIAVDAPPATLAGEPIALVSAVFVLGF